MSTNKYMNALIGVVIGVALFPVVNETVESIAANVTGVKATLLNLLPTLYLLVVVGGAAVYVKAR